MLKHIVCRNTECDWNECFDCNKPTVLVNLQGECESKKVKTTYNLVININELGECFVDKLEWLQCPKCKEHFILREFKYCPNCAAKNSLGG